MRFSALLLLPLLLAAQSIQVLVEDGFVSRHRQPGATAHIWARQNTATAVFAAWVGDTQHLLDPASPYTTLRLPTTNVRLRATYRTVPAWIHRTENFANIPVTYYIPPNAIGLVFMFHGTGGTGLGQFTSSEFQPLARDLVANGFGVAAFDCLNRNTGQWDTTTTGAANPDVIRVNNVFAEMRAQGIVAAGVPRLAFGHSNGGQFSHFSAQVLNWVAVYISCVQGSNPAAQNYNGPVAWWMGKNDDHPQVGPTGVATSIARYEIVANRGLASRHWIDAAMPLYPERFARSPFIAAADSPIIYDIFKSRGWLDENDFIIRNPNDDYWRAAMPSRFTAGQLLAIQGQLEATNAGHEWANYHPNLVVDHFLRALNRKPAIRPINGASYQGSTIAAASIATVFTPGIAPELTVANAANQLTLSNAKATLRDPTGREHPAPWFFVSPGQASFLVPASVPAGNAILKLESGDRRAAVPIEVSSAAPGIFTANGNGAGAPAALILRVTPAGVRTIEYPFAAGPAGFVAAPIRFQGDRLFLDFYATGLRGAGNNVQVILGGETIQPLYAGAQPQFAGLDQVTIELPSTFQARGRVEAAIVAAGQRSNTVELNFDN
jgi:uncharacterized protein (TIGR03437 family)